MDAAMARILAAKSPIDRLHIASRMWTAARAVIRAAVVADHGDWPAARVDREVASRLSHGITARVAR